MKRYSKLLSPIADRVSPHVAKFSLFPSVCPYGKLKGKRLCTSYGLVAVDHTSYNVPLWDGV